MVQCQPPQHPPNQQVAGGTLEPDFKHEGDIVHSQVSDGERRGTSLGTLTHYVELVGVVDAAVLVFHHTGIVPLVRGDRRLHDDGPHVVADLKQGDSGENVSHTVRKTRLVGVGAKCFQSTVINVREPITADGAGLRFPLLRRLLSLNTKSSKSNVVHFKATANEAGDAPP